MPEVEGAQDLPSVVRRYGALLEISESVASHQELSELLQDLASHLQQVTRFEFIQLAVYDSDRTLLRQQWVTTAGVASAQDISVEGSAPGEVVRTGKPLVMVEVKKGLQDGYLPGVPADVRSFALFPLTTPHGYLGSIGFASTADMNWDEPVREFLTRVAGLVALAAANRLAITKRDEYQNKLAVQRGHCSLLLEINKLLFSELEPQALFAAISTSLHSLLKHEYAFLVLHEVGTNRFRIQAMQAPSTTSFFQTGLTYPAEWSPSKRVLANGRMLVLSGDGLANYPTEISHRLYDEGVRSACWVPLLIGDRGIGTLCLASLQPNAFNDDDLDLLGQVGGQVAIALENAFAFGQVSQLIDKLEQEKLYLENEIGSPYRSDEIIGESEALASVIEQVRTVAPTPATVLLLGETGTGKELVARAMHRLSDRSLGPFVKVNCSAIPTGLMESELFGHEKGSFTGAIQQKIGRLELADKGTLFLDEVGDIPLELQPKLLRVLQEQEFERLGSNITLHVNVRIVAATNRHLNSMVDRGEFRNDLFYRLNVFPIHVPPLRERKEDIPLLVRHFVAKFASRMERRIGTIPPATMEALQSWTWPGNVRELENLIERAVILSPGRILNVPLAELKSRETTPPPSADATLAEAEKTHILRVLREAKGVIAGPGGAAARLGMKRTTLNYKMKKLGIDPRSL